MHGKALVFMAPIGPYDGITRTYDDDILPSTARDMAARVRSASPKMSTMHQLSPMTR